MLSDFQKVVKPVEKCRGIEFWLKVRSGRKESNQRSEGDRERD